MKAMILAAGLGTRLRPYSLHRPKPLFPLLDRPLLLHILDQLTRQGFGPFLVNAHHLKEQLVALLGVRPDLHLQLEETILGTGGGLRQALPHLGEAPILVMNGDTLLVADLAGLRARHLASGTRISLVVHDRPRFNNLRVLADGRLAAFRVGMETVRADHGERLLAFTGVSFLAPEVLRGIPVNTFCDSIDHFTQLLGHGETINTIEVRDHFWTDIGTPADYLDLHGALLRQQLSPWPEFLARPGSAFFVGRDVVVGEGAVLEEWGVVGSGARLGPGARVRRSVIWDHARVAAGELVEDRIVVA